MTTTKDIDQSLCSNAVTIIALPATIEFDYNAHAMDFEEDEGVWGEGGGKGEGEVSEAQLERMLLENLSSNEEEEEGPARKKRKM